MMSAELETYTQRRARIAAIIEPLLVVSALLPGPNAVDPDAEGNPLRCQWIDRGTGFTAVDVFVDAPRDIAYVLASLRAQVTGDDAYDSGTATEISCSAADEYAFIRHLAHSVTAIVGDCRIQVYPSDGFDELSAVVEPALQIGRAVGCAPYRDDFIPPPRPADVPRPHWSAGPGLPGIPPVFPESPTT